MYTPSTINYFKTASEISEWFERNFGYFVNKNSDKEKIVQDLAYQLERLPLGAMSYISQTLNDFVDGGNNRPPSLAEFIKALAINFNKVKKATENKTIKIYSIDQTGNKHLYLRDFGGNLISHQILSAIK